MKKITLGELINNYSKVDDEFPLGVTILNNDSSNTVVKIFTSRRSMNLILYPLCVFTNFLNFSKK